jgi:hypothetical protein
VQPPDGTQQHIKVVNRYARDIPESPQQNSSSTNKGAESTENVASLKEYCASIATQADELQKEMKDKLTNLLLLVDISMQLDVRNPDSYRDKRSTSVQPSDNSTVSERTRRSPFLAKFAFTTGIRMVWSLFGFVEKMRMNYKVKKLETLLATTQKRVDENKQKIADMSLVVYQQSIAIDKLFITTSELSKRMGELERRVDRIEKILSDVFDRMDATLSLSLIANLINRVQQSMNNGYDTLKDIIHCSLQGQTSPLLLPAKQLDLVQTEIKKSTTTGKLDADFANMQSIVVSDPRDNHLLLVVVNMAALDQQEVTLIKMVPIPFYEGENTYTPILDYDTILLNKKPQTYSILSEQEEHDCIFNRCYVSDVERPVSDKSCGIPQYYDQHLTTCVSEHTLTQGIFLKPMLPDGIIFALESEVTARLFCEDNEERGPANKLNGTGIMRLPNGCTLTVTDKNQKITQVKGQPLYRMVQVDILNLSANEPLGTTYMPSGNVAGTQRLSAQGNQLTNHLLSVVKHIDNVDDKLSRQTTYVWSLVGLVLIIMVVITTTITIMYKFSGKFRLKIYDLRERFAEVSQKFSDIEDDIVNRRRGLPPSPNIAPRPQTVEALIARARARNLPDNSSTYLSLNEMRQQRGDTNESIIHVPSSFKPVVKAGASCHYPSLTPLFHEAKEMEENDMDTESKEVDSLCHNKPLLTNHR